jgi:WD40 repeat protein
MAHRGGKVPLSCGFEHAGSFKGHKDTVTGVLSQEHNIITCSLDGTIRLWSLDFENLSMFTAHVDGVTCMVLDASASPGRERIVISAGWDHMVKEWDVHNCRLLRARVGHTSTVVSICSWHSLIISGDADGHIHVYSQSQTSSSPLQVLRKHTASVRIFAPCIITGCWLHVPLRF